MPLYNERLGPYVKVYALAVVNGVPIVVSVSTQEVMVSLTGTTVNFGREFED